MLGGNPPPRRDIVPLGVRIFVALSAAFAFLIPLGSSAIESGPSNTVGFWKVDVHPGYTQISFPLLPADKSVDNVLADQLTGGSTPAESDQVLRWAAAAGQFQMCWYDASTQTWQGDFNQFSEAESYWTYVQPDHPETQTIITFGNVVQAPFYNMGMMTSGYNAVGSVWAIPAAISLAGLNGFAGGLYLFQSDLIMSYDASTGSYSYAWQDGGGNWLGDLTQFEPLMGYWIYIAPGHTGFDWSTFPQPGMSGTDYVTKPFTKPVILSTGTSPGETTPGLNVPVPIPVQQLQKGAQPTSGGSSSPAKGGAR